MIYLFNMVDVRTILYEFLHLFLENELKNKLGSLKFKDAARYNRL